ncbi:hypothetical protein GDO81_003033 [Engystomops pustulosus]|uniref:Uncharacterized protein n=1 Tax=Engystomops pustulosus TaxID=76066 RepID=A0AAV6ZZR8_ENGPU|nr:hypothetical protein GDO81_003033 [Engystomops pustulosus]
MWVSILPLWGAIMCVSGANIGWYQPEQVHLSYTGHPRTMTVTWSTFNWTPSVVEFNPLTGTSFLQPDWLMAALYLW